jgi:hypothetical protein
MSNRNETVTTSTTQRLRAAWPLLAGAIVFLVGLAVAGLGGGVVGATLAMLVLGPAYLIQNHVRRRRGTLVVVPKTQTEKDRSDARVLRVAALAGLPLAAGVLALFAAGGGHAGLEGSAWTAALLIYAAIAVFSAPYLWALAEWRATGRELRWAWGLAGAVELGTGVAALSSAAKNQRDNWIGGNLWTIGLALLGLFWLLGAAGNIQRARLPR